LIKHFTALILASFISFTSFNNSKLGSAQSIKSINIHNKDFLKDFNLTSEQIEMIKQKKAELKIKYFSNLDELTEVEKQEAKKKYRAELRLFLEEELGIDFSKRSHHFFD
jgi:hypothetical protein